MPDSILKTIGFNRKELMRSISKFSVRFALSRSGLAAMLPKLRMISPDISRQEFSEKTFFNEYFELKRRGLQAFQCSMMLKAIEGVSKSRITVVDIGDSAGTHMLYLRELTKGRFNIETLSVNLDPRAIEKIRARGLEAVLCRAEELDLGERSVDLFTSFEMVEHLHNPAIFFRRMAKKACGDRMVVTVPYLRASRVGLAHVRRGLRDRIFAEDEHIFELSPEDWTLLMLHSGWKVVASKVYRQYPSNWFLVSDMLAAFWRRTDYEGFWGAILEKDTSFSDLYQDWEN